MTPTSPCEQARRRQAPPSTTPQGHIASPVAPGPMDGAGGPALSPRGRVTAARPPSAPRAAHGCQAGRPVVSCGHTAAPKRIPAWISLITTRELFTHVGQGGPTCELSTHVGQGGPTCELMCHAHTMAQRVGPQSYLAGP